MGGGGGGGGRAARISGFSFTKNLESEFFMKNPNLNKKNLAG